LLYFTDISFYTSRISHRNIAPVTLFQIIWKLCILGFKLKETSRLEKYFWAHGCTHFVFSWT